MGIMLVFFEPTAITNAVSQSCNGGGGVRCMGVDNFVNSSFILQTVLDRPEVTMDR